MSTSTTRMTSTKVTRERGIGLLLILVLVTHPPQDPNAIAQRAIKKDGDSVREGEHDRHHDGGLRDERQAREPQFDAVPPVEEAAHPASVFDAKIASCRPRPRRPPASSPAA